MEILLTPQLVKIYINTRSKFQKTTEEQLISQVFETKTNHFVLNKALLDLFEQEFPENTSERDFFRDEFATFINNQSISISASGANLKLLLQSMEREYLALSRNQTYVNLSFNDIDSTQSKFSATLSNLNNQRDYLFYDLAARGKTGLTFWQHNFQTNLEIQTFFNYLYDLRQGDNVDIFDAFTNFGHSYHDKMINESARFNYYTKSIYNTVERNDNKDEIVAKYLRVTVRRARRSQIHERRIMFMDMIIEVSNDWQNLLIEEPTWKIDIFICEETCRKISSKKPLFRA
ncbi:hypothetical protein [Flavobacterium anhuiense]|uniref:hypothetical protein n=1 Tax=Flavobacterium anhuiense TaxID=459526 RepID=UPI000E6CFA44|nr:hypothetical protein [Flavobacterium anhuiense]